MFQDLSQYDLMEIKLFMYITDRKLDIFDPGGDSIRPDGINSGLYILQATDSFKKCNANKF